MFNRIINYLIVTTFELIELKGGKDNKKMKTKTPGVETINAKDLMKRINLSAETTSSAACEGGLIQIAKPLIRKRQGTQKGKQHFCEGLKKENEKEIRQI